MKKTNLLLLSTLLVSVYLFIACDDEDNIIPTSEGQITIDASDYSTWVYFSFDEDTIVPVNDFKNSTNWDLGFNRYNLRVNCGTSGPGNGGTYATGETMFSNLVIAPENGYSVNDSIEVVTDISSMPPVMETVPGDTLLASWIEMSYNNNGPVYTYSNEIFVIKTAKGKYAKIWLKDYFNDEAKSGNVTMKYLYQPDGSIKLE